MTFSGSASVLHIAETLRGGPASYLEEIIPHQVDALGPHNVRVLAPATQLSELSAIPQQVVLPSHSSGRSLTNIVMFAREIRSAKKRFRPDVMHLHSTFAGVAGRLSWPIGRGATPAVVYCAHGWAFAMDIPDWKKWLFAQAERLLSVNSDVIINISHQETAAAAHYRVPARKLIALPNAIAKDAPTSGDSPLVLEPDRMNFLFVGRLDRQKGIDILLAAMDLLHDQPIHLHVIGETVVNGKPFDQGPHRSNVTFYGWQARPSVTKAMDDCDALIVPSRWEGFGLVVLEAMRASKAVFASGAGALPEIIEDGRSGHIFPSLDASGIAASLQKATLQHLKEMGARGRDVFADKFTSDRLNADLLGLYSRLVPNKQFQAHRDFAKVAAT